MPSFQTSADLVVVGGGVIGLAAARDAASRGLRVSLFDRGAFGGEATRAAAGMLSPVAEAGSGGSFLELGLRSLRMYGSWVEELEARSGVPVEFRRSGKLLAARSSAETEELEARRLLGIQCGVSMDWLTGEEVHSLVPGLDTAVTSALVLHEDHRVDSRALGRALSEAALREGVGLHPGRGVRGILREGDRVLGVELEDGTRITGGAILVAAGAWSSELEGLPRPLGVRPVRGQMLALRPAVLPSSLVLETHDVYLVPRDNGHLLVGATVESEGFRKENTARGIRTLLNAAIRAVPSLEESTITEMWSGFRPGTADGRPILGPDPALDGLFLATGHYRNGILLAPATARLIGALVAGEPVEHDPLASAFVPAPAGT